MNLQRVYKLNDKQEITSKPVAYWMSRDQRVDHNWAFLYAYQKAQHYKQPLYVFFALAPTFLDATLRQYDFMLKGLEEVEQRLKEIGAGFYMVLESPEKGIPALVEQYNIGTLITDFSPLRIGREWRCFISKHIDCAMCEVDAHNVVPCRVTSQKQEFAAHTLRPKIQKLLPTFLDTFPSVHTVANPISTKKTDWEHIKNSLSVDRSVKPVNEIVPGIIAAHKTLKYFIAHKLTDYNTARNDVSKNGQSDLSPYLHFGQISAQYIAQKVIHSSVSQKAKDVFLEELIVRRELSDNYCYYNPHYDSVEGFPQWAQKTLKKHISDKRQFIYSSDEFENAQTHDEVWNQAQKQMVECGIMHGYLRMYWAKKILEWTENPERALEIAIYLNDKYELDGRDPNGYVGIAWSIGGLHDRPWFERDVYGMIRYMSSTKIEKMWKK